MASKRPTPTSKSQRPPQNLALALGKAISELLASPDAHELQRRMPEELAHLMGAELALLIRQNGDELEVVASCQDDWQGRHLPPNGDASALAFKTSKPVLWQREGGEPLALATDYSSALALPLGVDEPLALSCYRQEPFTCEELELAESLLAVVPSLWTHFVSDDELALQVEAQQAELRQADFKISQLQEQVSQSERVKAEFVATMSHELRTPLNVVLGFGSLLADEAFGELNEQQVEACQKIMESSERLAGLINDLLDFSSLQAHMLDLHFHSVELPALLAAVMEDIRPLAERKELEVSLELENKLPRINADPDRLWQVLKHLTDNALKFTPPGGSLGVRAYGAPEEDGVVIEVWDTGIGIPPEAMHRLFERFYQVDSSNTRLYGGTGIGLSLVKELVERHGGTVSVESSVGKGSTFRLLLPVMAHADLC